VLKALADILRMKLVFSKPMRGSDRMSDIAGPVHPFQFGVFDDVTGLKGFVQCDVDIFVDYRGDEKSAVVPVIGGEVGAATPQCDAQRIADITSRTLVRVAMRHFWKAI
jgi:hypothetical protein